MMEVILPFSPQVECEVSDVGIQLGREIQKRLQDVPCADSCGIGRICCIRIDQRVSALTVGPRRLIREAYANWLAQVQHVRFFVP